MRNINIFATLLAMSALVSCNLDVISQDSISPDTYFSKESELELYTNQFYTLEPAAEDIYDEPSNLIVSGNTLPAVMVGVTRTVPSSGGGWSWSMLRHINYFLANSGRCADEAARDHYNGVALFFRAYFYFDKVVRFGDVPWYSEALYSDDKAQLTKPQDGRDLVVENILKDLDEAIKLLPATVSLYEVNKYTAMALKSRVCLFEGTFRKYHAGKTFNKNNLPHEELLKECAKVSKELIESNKYSLYTTGETPYLSLSTADEASKAEVIFARCFKGNFKNLVDQFALVSTKGAAGFTKALTASYLMKDGTRFTDKTGWQTMTFQQEIVDRDPRFAQTVLTKAGKFPDKTAMTFKKENSCTGYSMIKYVTGQDHTAASAVDMPLFKISEVYLNYAEALAELGTLTQADLDKSVNLLRDRVGMPHMNMAEANAKPDAFLTSELYGYVNVTGANKGVILEIRRERGIELVCEGLRFQDICRWREGHLMDQPVYGFYVPGEGVYDIDGDGTDDFVVNGTSTYSASGVTPVEIGKSLILSEGTKGFIQVHADVIREFNEDRDYLYPIPSNEISLTNGNLKQNPGWTK